MLLITTLQPATWGSLTYTLALIPDSENSSRIQCFNLAPDRLSALCNDADWCKKVTCLARALVALASSIPTLPKHCKIPESGQEALLQFVFVPLAVRAHLHIIFFVCKVRCANPPVVCSVTWLLNGRKARSELVLKQTSQLLSWKYT